jgi:hypothetical protein
MQYAQAKQEEVVMGAQLAVEQSVGDVRTERPLTPREVASFERDGFVVVPGFFSPEEIAPLAEACVGSCARSPTATAMRRR